jgi:SARP family transcriptional regulator, regulator of embCAB operon
VAPVKNEQAPAIRLRLLGCFRLSIDGRRVEIPAVSARILAYLGLQGAEVQRSAIARVLWPDAGRSRSLGNLRSALWRLPTCSRRAVLENGCTIGLSSQVQCDVALLENEVLSATTPSLSDVMSWGWCDELLAGWYDDWVLEAREQFQRRRATALERLSNICCSSGLTSDAVLYATLAVGADPLRETAHQALLRAHLRQGNRVEARDHYLQLVTRLDQELGVAPSAETCAIMASSGREPT